MSRQRQLSPPLPFPHSCSTIQEEELTWTDWLYSLKAKCLKGCGCGQGLSHGLSQLRLGNLSPARRWREATDFLLNQQNEDGAGSETKTNKAGYGWLEQAAKQLGPAAKHEFINDLLEAQWPYISEWFNDTMRSSCEPALQALMPPGITIEFGERCSLGTRPSQLENFVASKFTEDHGTSIRLDAMLNYHGDCHVDVTCTVGSLELTGLEVKGEIVIELVRLRKQPPWFSGVRIYFPNPPKVDLTLKTALFGLDATANFSFLKRKIVDALTGVISHQAVLPNRFCIPMGDAIGLVDLKSPTPQGILRLVILEAKDLPDPGRSHWSNMMLRFGWSQEATEADPYVQATIGAQVEKTSVVTRSRAPQWEDATFDFVVDDPNLQNLHLGVHDNDTGAFSWKQAEILGSVEQKLTALLEGQELVEVKAEGVQLPEIVLSLGRILVPAGSVKVRAEWRPLAPSTPTGGAPVVDPVPGLWSIGRKNQHEWLLVVDTLSASALPGHGLGLNHWVKLGIQFDGADVGPSYETGLALGAGPLEHGKHLLESMGIRPDIAQILQSHPDRIYSLWRSHVPTDQRARDMEQKGNTVYGLTGPPVFVDAVWNHNSRILLDSLPSMSLTLTVFRLEKGQRNPKDGTVLGSASMPLEELLKTHQCRFEGLLPFKRNWEESVPSSVSRVQVRLRLHALAAPPSAGTSYAAKPPKVKRTYSRTSSMRDSMSKWYDSVSVTQFGNSSRWNLIRQAWSSTPKGAETPSDSSSPSRRPEAAPGGNFVPRPPEEPPPPDGSSDLRSRRYVATEEEEFHEAIEEPPETMMGRFERPASWRRPL